MDVFGYTDERQDWIITPTSIKAAADTFKAYFWAQIKTGSRVSEHGIVHNGTVMAWANSNSGALTSAYVLFEEGGETVIDLRVGTSLISESTAKSHIDAETRGTLEDTAREVRESWVEKLDRVKIEGATEAQKEVFYTAFFHSLTVSEPACVDVFFFTLGLDQYPNEQTENGKYWSGYDGRVHEAAESYTGYSIWDTYRAEWAWLILLAPERVPGMITSMLADYKEVSYNYHVQIPYSQRT